MKVSATETSEVSHTSEVSGASKFIFVGVLVPGRLDRLVEHVGEEAGDDHHDAHHEDPHQQLHLGGRVVRGEEDEGDQRDAGHAVGLEAVRRRADGIAGVVTGAVGDDARVPGVVLLDPEDDLHQVRADVGDLGEDAAGDAKRRGAQRLADGEADEARTREVRGNEEQDAEHDQQLGADERPCRCSSRRGAGWRRSGRACREGRRTPSGCWRRCSPGCRTRPRRSCRRSRSG